MKFVIYRDAKGEWRWNLKARNGRIVADSGEGYKRQHSAIAAVYRLMDARLPYSPVIVVK